MGKWLDRWRDSLFRKYTEDELETDVLRYLEGTGCLHLVTRQWFDEAMYRCVGKHGIRPPKFPDIRTPMDAVESDEFMDVLFGYMWSHSRKLFKEMKERPTLESDLGPNDFVNIRRYFTFNTPRKVAQFPSKAVRTVIGRLFPDHDTFCPPLNFHDMSCGFGMREACALLYSCSYFGTDPNRDLHSGLQEMGAFLKRRFPYAAKGSLDVRCQGSETFIPEWEGMMDISMSSPPYFSLETYSDDGCASTRNYGDYGRWLEEYAVPTVRNCIRYLKPAGWLCINVKNTVTRPLYDDFVSVIAAEGMELGEPIDLKMDYERGHCIKSWLDRGVELRTNEIESYHEKIIVSRKPI